MYSHIIALMQGNYQRSTLPLYTSPQQCGKTRAFDQRACLTHDIMTTVPPVPPSRKLIPTSQPISTLPTDLARLYTTIHPLLLLTLYYFAFPFLVSDPVRILLNSLLPLSVLQLGYVVTCLPNSGSTPSVPPAPSKASKSGQRKRLVPARQNVGLGGKVVVSIAVHNTPEKK